MIKLCEIYKSIVGEGTFTGKLAIILRLTGCNLRCTWCDTAYAYDEGQDTNIAELLRSIVAFKLKRILITGGEPLLQEDIYPLMEELTGLGYEISIETNGSMDVSRIPRNVHRIIDIKPPGSGMTGHMLWTNLQLLGFNDEVKFVISDRQDYEWSREVVNKYGLVEKAGIYFQPVWGRISAEQLAQYIIEDNMDVNLGIQLHKIIWGERRRI